MYESVMLYWVLPSLIFLLFQLRFLQGVGGNTLKDVIEYDNGFFVKMMLVFSIIYPAGCIIYIIMTGYLYHNRKSKKPLPVAFNMNKIYNFFCGEIKWRE